MGRENILDTWGRPSPWLFNMGQGMGVDKLHHIPPTDYGLDHPSFALDEHILPLGVLLPMQI